MRTLVIGGTRSGKSAFAESLLDGRADVTYVATGPSDGDEDWQARIVAHRRRRPDGWQTDETSDVAAALRTASGPTLVDGLGTWLTRQLDEVEAWEKPQSAWGSTMEVRLASLVAAWTVFEHDLVAVSDEVGWGLVSEHRSGRIFADWMGDLNQQLAAVSDRVMLVVAGQMMVLKHR